MDLNQAMEEWLSDRLAPLEARLRALESLPSPAPDPQTPPVPPVVSSLDLHRAQMGMNLGYVNYYTPSFPWPDLMRYAHTNDARGAWMGSDVSFDSDGYPLSVVPPQEVFTIVAQVGGRYPGGNYTLSWEGKGSLRLSGDAQGTFSSSPATVLVTPSSQGITVKITSSDKADHLRALSLKPVIHVDHWSEKHRPYGVLRFMDWGMTNNSPLTTWLSRKRPSERSVHGDRGVSYEDMIDICNRNLSHPWVCIPHKADGSYVSGMAALFLERLDKRLTPVLEYSNECWNGGFTQTGWLEGLSGSENVRQTYARKAVEAFNSWKTVWGSRRFLRVLCGQSANPDVGKQILAAAAAMPGELPFDAYGIAPYFGHKADITWTVDVILDHCATDVIAQRKGMDANKAMAASFGVPLVAYEGGQHITISQDSMVSKLREVQNHPRMEGIYRTYFDHWKSAGGGLFCHFNDIFPARKSGAWGMYEYDAQEENPPKSKAIIETSRLWG